MAESQSQVVAVKSLQRLGFSEYEARAYVTLLRKSRLNGYEVAKESGIPRANIYPVLSKLVERGAVLSINTDGGPRYSPLDPKQLLERIESEQREALQATTQSLEGVGPATEADEVLSARGYSALIDHVRSAIAGASKSVLLALYPSEAQQIERETTAAEQRGAAITILCLTGCPADCGCCRGQTYRYNLATSQKTRWLIASVDGDVLVAGQIQGDDAAALITRQPMLVDLTSAYIRQSIAMASVISDLGPQLQQSLKPQTRQILQSVSPQSERTFIDYMSDLMSRAQLN
jgi:sugar-specific transcriptional regulator TrmB